jgi:hypothetical protein
MTDQPAYRWRGILAGFLLLVVCCGQARAEAMLQYFNTSWAEITRKMPELAEAGYSSLWLPPPTKGSGGLSVGYDLWDPFDLGSKDQRNTVTTRYGTEAELLRLVETAHRFGIRIYFDNIMNHRAFDVPGYNESTPIDVYPGMVPEDFHLRKTSDGFYRKWDNTRDWGSAWQVQNLGLADLIDIAHESPNANFGMSEGSTHPKYPFVRDLERPAQYDKDASGNTVYFGWLIDRARAMLGLGASPEQLRLNARQYISDNANAYKEDVGAYLIRAARWEMDRTKADGLRLDAVKHVPDYFFGRMSGPDKDASSDGYLGGVQWQFNRTRGFSDTNQRDSVFDEKKGRDDAMVFGEHLGQPPGYSGYWDAGMRLVDNDLRSKLNGSLGNMWGTLAGLDASGAGGFASDKGVTHAISHDNDYAAQKEWQHAFYMTREGMGLIYTDGYYQAETLGESGGAFPRHANTQFLGQYSDPRIPNILKIHQDLARGLQQGRWADSDYLAFERRDNRDEFGNTPTGNAADEITMVAMFNDNTAQGQARGISTSFPAGAYLYQYAEGPNGSYQVGFYKYAWELGNVVVPPGGYYVFGYRTPELSTLWPRSAVTLYQNGEEVPRITVTRKDGPDGDKSFNPHRLDNRGFPAGTTPEDYSYQTTIPVVKSGSPLTIIARADGSAENILLKLDGGVDLNNGAPPGNTDPAKRDYPPGIYSDIWNGYEQPLLVDRQHPEKFAAINTARCQIGSPGAETYVKTVGGGFTTNNSTAVNDSSTFSGNVSEWLYHDPGQTVGGPSGTSGVGDLQFNDSGADIVLWAKSSSVGAGFKMFVYYTTDGSFPEGAGGIGRGTTKSAELNFRHNQIAPDPGSWWGSASIPKPASGVVTYKIGIYRTEKVPGANPAVETPSWWPGSYDSVAYKKKMLTTFRVENFDPAAVVHFPHNDYARVPDKDQAYDQWGWATQAGLSEGFHVIRGRAFLPNGKGGRGLNAADLYQTFTQTFYYDAATPQGGMAFPGADGQTIGGSSYEMVVRTDATVEEVWYHIDDSEPGNNDDVTEQLNGNGSGFEPFTDANQNRTRDTGEKFVDVNGDGTYTDALGAAWAKATEVTPSLAITSPYEKEWRFRYNNVPASGNATVTFRLLEASSSRTLTLSAPAAHVTEVVRSVQTRGPDERLNIAWPQSDGDRVDDNYAMKVYFTKALSSGATETQLKSRFTFYADGVAQDRDSWAIDYGSFGGNGAFHELSISLPNLYNDLPDFLHTLRVVYRFPDDYSDLAKRGLEIESVRLVKASPSTKPFVRITRPSELGSDGKQTEIILPDVAPPQADRLLYTIRVESSSSVSSLALTGSPAIALYQEPFTDTNANGIWDAQEPSTDKDNDGNYDPPEAFVDTNANGVWDSGETFTDANNNLVWDAGETYTDVNNNHQFDTGEPSELFDDTNGNNVRDPAEPFTDTNLNGTHEGVKVSVSGSTKTWDYSWEITAPGNYLLTAQVSLNGQDTSTSRNARVVLRQVVDPDGITDNDDDNDGLVDLNETNGKDLPETNTDTWKNGDVHIHYAYGRSLPTSPDSDGDGLPDGLEVGWRVAGNPPTNPATDTNGDGIPNFLGDLDPPLYAVVENSSAVPGVGNVSEGDNRSRQAAGSVTDPMNPDTDSDGIPDGKEDANHNGWTDGDGKSLPLTATIAQYVTARPNSGDWPNNLIDSYSGGARENWTETSPTKADSDGDGLSDGFGEDKDANGLIAGDTNNNRSYDAPELWTETDPLKADTDGDGLPDGWESQYGLDPLNNGITSMRTGTAALNADNGADGDPDHDTFDNLAELAAGTNPNQVTLGGDGSGEGTIHIGTFSDWKHTDLLALDEYNEGGSQGADVYRSWNDTDTSRDIVAFSFRDGGAASAGGDGRVYFRVDFMDLAPNAWEGEVDAYIVIDTGNTAAGEQAMPNEVDVATDMKWEAVIAVYGQNFGTIFVDRDAAKNTSTKYQNPVTDGGVEARGFGGLSEAAWSSRYDALEIAVDRQQLLDAGWLAPGDPNSLHFQVFTTKPNTTGSNTGDLAGRNDIRDTISDDWIASDYWKDQDNIALNGKLSQYFGRSTANDRNKSAKVMLLAHGNQPINPGSTTQSLIKSSSSPSAGYFRLLQTHENYRAPLSLHITPTLASAIQWAKNPSPGTWPNNDGPTFNARLATLRSQGIVDLLGSTFADHVPKYFPSLFNESGRALSNRFLDAIYANGGAAASRKAFWAPERVLDDESLQLIQNLGYTHTFADQGRHLLKWFGRTAALGTDGYRITSVNGMKIFPIHDGTSEYLDQTKDEGSSQAVRELLSRRSRSGTQDQVVVLWRDLGDFSNDTKASSYDTNIRWLGSRPWIRVVSASDIIEGRASYIGQDGNATATWGTVTQNDSYDGNGNLVDKDANGIFNSSRNLVQTAKDWIDHATQENYGNWYFGSPFEQGLSNLNFGATDAFGQVGVGGHSNTTWLSLSAAPFSAGLGDLADAVFQGAMFQTAFHNTANSNLSKYSTGDYIWPDTDGSQTLSDFAKFSQSQARFAKVYARVQQWADSATSSTLGAESSDVDLDGAMEFLLYNSRVFALFEAKGGRMTAAWMRDPNTRKLWQVAGNFASYSGTETEDEGADNFVGATTAINARRTSGFKDWWTINTSSVGSNSGVNATYNVTAAPGGTGWTFANGGITKTIRLANAFSERLEATYTLTGLNKAYVRFGLSPNLLDLMIRGQAGLAETNPVPTRVNLTNTGATDTVRAWVEAPQINSDATDVAATGFTTVLRRNQAQTSQVEVELTGAGPHVVTLGFDLGTDLTNPDTDNDGLPDEWETANFQNLNRDGTGDADSDGLLDRTEFLIGSNPNSASSGQPLTAVSPTTGGFTFSFPTIAGRIYQPQVSTDLVGWSPLGSPIAGDGTTKSATDLTAGPKRFYRLTISLP